MNNQTQNSHNNISKQERLAKFTKKISQAPTETTGTSKYLKIDNKINSLEINLLENIELLDRKYNALKDQISNITNNFEEDKINKEDGKYKQNDDIKKFEDKFRNMLIEERYATKIYSEEVFKTIENSLKGYEKEIKSESDIIKTTLVSLQKNFEGEIIKVNNKVEGENEDRIRVIQNLVNEMNVEFGKVHEIVFILKNIFILKMKPKNEKTQSQHLLEQLRN